MMNRLKLWWWGITTPFGRLMNAAHKMSVKDLREAADYLQALIDSNAKAHNTSREE